MKKIKLFVAALLLSVSSLLGLNMGKVFAATCTWTGASSDNFNTAANWSNCGSGAPQNGDNITFDITSLSSAKTLTNNITSLSVGTVTFTGSNGSGYNYKLTGNTLTITGGIVANAGAVLDLPVTVGANQTWSGSSYINIGEFGGTNRTLALGSNTLTMSATSLNLYGALTGTGAVANSGLLFLNNDSPSWSGAISTTASGNTSVFTEGALGSGPVTVASGGSLNFCGVNGATFSNDITVGGATALNSNIACGMGGSTDNSKANVNLTGDITLTADTTVRTAGIMKLTGALSGSYTLTVASGSAGTLVIDSSNNTSKTPNGSSSAAAGTVTVEAGDDQPNLAVNVTNNQTYIINGTRGNTVVEKGGVLKGSGKVGALAVFGHVAPGQSPGCLTSDSLTLEDGSVYEFEVAGTTACSQYDQLKVTNGPVAINGGSVTLTLLDGFKPKQGQVFVIIDNAGANTVSGAFTNLPEGATFAANGYVYKISYAGGTGNDVTLTVMTVPASPDTGFAMIKNNPLLTMTVMMVIGGALLIVARRAKLAGAVRKR